ncbi:MAG: hypothetical protein IJK28_12325 [Clostridia bacterium]|nr:hypothetical protein [Clostridia bacterium]
MSKIHLNPINDDHLLEIFPTHFTDVGEASVLASRYKNKLCYSEATRWMSFDGQRWVMGDQNARRAVHELVKTQEDIASNMEKLALIEEQQAERDGDKLKATQARNKQSQAQMNRRSALTYQQTNKVSAVLREAAPYLEIRIEDLDAIPEYLNTPAGTVDLRSGEVHPHNPADMLTMITGCSPSRDGAVKWLEFIDSICESDKELSCYLQEVVGAIAIGKVYSEQIFIAIGPGGNGKSTFFNAIATVLGDYSFSVPADILTLDTRMNKNFIYGDLRGKRLILAAELREGQRLDSSAVKLLSSTDPIRGEHKFKDGFVFTPSHTAVLYTNVLPKVRATDDGTWDRLVLIPFNARFRGQSGEKKNYADWLVNNCGGAILTWIIEGAKRFIENGYKLTPPQCVKDMIAEYRAESDMLQRFILERCVQEKGFRQPSGALYLILTSADSIC